MPLATRRSMASMTCSRARAGIPPYPSTAEAMARSGPRPFGGSELAQHLEYRRLPLLCTDVLGRPSHVGRPSRPNARRLLVCPPQEVSLFAHPPPSDRPGDASRQGIPDPFAGPRMAVKAPQPLVELLYVDRRFDLSLLRSPAASCVLHGPSACATSRESASQARDESSSSRS